MASANSLSREAERQRKLRHLQFR